MILKILGWGAAGFAFNVWFAPAVGPMLIPASNYLDVREIRVDERTVLPALPNITPDRDIHANVWITRVSTVRRLTPDGFLYVCRGGPEGRIPVYEDSPAAAQPRSINQWMSIPPNGACDWTPGEYKITTEWLVQYPWLPSIELPITLDSNTFTLYPEGTVLPDALRPQEAAQ